MAGFGFAISIAYFAGIVLAFLILTRLFFVLLRTYKGLMKGKKGFFFSEEFIKALVKPSYFILFLLGIYVAYGVSFGENALLFHVLRLLMVAGAAFLVMRISGSLVDYYREDNPGKRKGVEGIIILFDRLVKVLLAVLFIIVLLNSAGVEVTPLLASLGIAGLAVALAFQDTLSNFFAGMYLVIDRPVRIGDFIKLEGGQEGFIVKIGWRSTQIRMLSNNTIIAPNNKVAQSVIVNYSTPESSMIIEVPLRVKSGEDLERVQKTALEAAKKVHDDVNGVFEEFKPQVRFTSFHEDKVEFSVFLRVRGFSDQFTVRHELIKALNEKFRKEKIGIV